MLSLGTVRPGSTIYIPFDTFAGSTGASITMTGLSTADILIYKNGGTTQRASTTGFTLLDTDGIDFDGITGIHGFSIDLSSNATADFYTAGAFYWIVVSTITVDSQTVSFVAASFYIGYPDAILDTTIATLSTQTSFTLTTGPAEDDALNGCTVIIHDIASAVQIGKAVVNDYTGSTKTVTLVAGVTFTAAAGDNISVLQPVLQPTTWGRTLDVSATGEAGLDWANIGSPTTAQNLSATNIDVDQVVASVSGAVGSVTGNVGGNVAGSVASVTARVTANVDQLGGVAQSLADLKDFADDGYDPATNKVQGVVLVDTLTTYTGNTPQTGDSFARLGAPAAASVSADILAIDNLVDDLESRVGTPSDLGSGATVAANLVDIEGQTDDIGVAGAGLTAVPWNAAWDAEVQSEVDDALVARFLDKLVIVNGTADSGSTTTMVDAARTEADNDYWKGRLILFTSGSISGQCAIITDFVAATDTFTFAPPLTQAVSTQTYVILPGLSVWDDTLAEHLIAGSTGSALNAAGAAGDPWTTTLPGAYGAGSAGFIVGTNVDATISSRSTVTTAQVNSEVDTALADVNLDHLVGTATGIPAIPAGTYIDQMMDDGTAVYDRTTDSLQAIRDRGDAAWTTATGFSTLTQADVRTAVGLASANLDTQLTAIDDLLDTEVAAIKAKTDQLTFTSANKVDATIQAAGDLAQAAADKVWSTAARTLTAFGFSVTVGTNNDKTGYSLSAAGIQAIWDALTAALTTAGSIGKLLVDNVNATISSRSSHTAADVWAVATRLLTAGTNIVLAKGVGVTGFNDLSAAQINAEVVDVVSVDTIADSVAADGSRPTINQALLMVTRFLLEKQVAGTTVTVKKEDGSTTSFTLTLDSGVTPTSITRIT